MWGAHCHRSQLKAFHIFLIPTKTFFIVCHLLSTFFETFSQENSSWPEFTKRSYRLFLIHTQHVLNSSDISRLICAPIIQTDTVPHSPTIVQFWIAISCLLVAARWTGSICPTWPTYCILYVLDCQCIMGRDVQWFRGLLSRIHLVCVMSHDAGFRIAAFFFAFTWCSSLLCITINIKF